MEREAAADGADPLSGAERRRAARVLHVEGADGIRLTVELRLAGGVAFPAVLRDTSAGGARLAFQAASPPELGVGTPCEVRFQEQAAERPVVATGQVVHQMVGAGMALIGVRFTRREELYRQLTPALWARFNRRKFVRVAAGGEVLLRSGDARWRVPAVDLSRRGVGVALSPAEARSAEDYELVDVALELGDGEGALEVTALVVHRTPHGPDVRHGLVFDEDLNPDLAARDRRLARVVEARAGADAPR